MDSARGFHLLLRVRRWQLEPFEVQPPRPVTIVRIRKQGALLLALLLHRLHHSSRSPPPPKRRRFCFSSSSSLLTEKWIREIKIRSTVAISLKHGVRYLWLVWWNLLVIPTQRTKPWEIFWTEGVGIELNALREREWEIFQARDGHACMWLWFWWSVAESAGVARGGDLGVS